MSKEPSDEIDRIAAAWAAKLDRAPLAADQEQDLEQWLATDARHLGAFAKARAVSMMSHRARALGSSFDPTFMSEEAASSAVSRRGALWLGGVAAASVATVGAFHLLQPDMTYVTRRGELRVVPLDDGSVLTINTASQAQVDYTNETRVIRLFEGEALFDVAKDPARPFVVHAGDTIIRAVGTSFSVRHLGDASVQVLVREGVVEVRRTSAAGKPLLVQANRRAIATSTNARVAPVPPVEMTRQLAWHQGQLLFEGETLADAAKEFARYSDVHIRIDDPAVANESIVGLFTANDPIAFAKAAATSLELRAEISSGEVRLSR